MARSFASASSQYLSVSSAALTADPITMAAWFYPSTTHSGTILAITDHDFPSGRWQLTTNTSPGNVLTIIKQNTGGSQTDTVHTTNTYSASQWHHAVGVFTSTATRFVFLDADDANKGAGSTSVANITAPSKTSIGMRELNSTPAGFFNGRIAHAAIWNAALTAAEVAKLYNSGIGVDPRSVRPDSLVAYWPLINGDGDQDYWGNYHLTASGSPTYAQHPPSLMRSRPKYVILGSAAPTVGEVTITGTRTIGETITANATPTPGDATLTYQWEKSATGSGSGTDISGETASTLALTYADFGDILDTAAYVRCGVVATKDAVPSVETFSSWLEVSAGGAASVGSPFVSSSIR